MRKILWISAVLFIACAASAQSFSVFDIDTSNFPIMKAKFYAFDAAGKQQSPLSSEIKVKEDGFTRTVLSVTCLPEKPPIALSSVLVMDVSGSMTGPNLAIARAAATVWVEGLPLGSSECALSSFDDGNYFNQDFTTNKTRLLAAIGTLDAGGGTDYDKGLLLPLAGGLQITKLGKHQKVIVFLTDGLCSSAQVNTIIAEANSQNCQIFTVTVGLACPQLLKDISVSTGGLWFEDISSEKQITDVYTQILMHAQGGGSCEIRWESDNACADGLRELQLIWKDIVSVNSYISPIRSVADLWVSPKSIRYRSKPLGQSYDTTITVTAVNGAFTVTNITSSNPLYSITPANFTLASGASLSLTVRFTPSDSFYSWTRFEILTNECGSIPYYASSTYPGHPPLITSLKLLQPNGGEILVVGSDTVITWNGIPLSESVQLEYSTDNGATWIAIHSNAINGIYSWHIPRTPSDECIVRVIQKAGDGWAVSMGSLDTDIGNSIAVDKGNIYVTGYFTDEAQFGDTLFLKDRFSGDTFLEKLRSDGSVEWARRAESKSPDAGWGVATDHTGNIFLTGHYDDILTIGDTVLRGSTKSSMFIAKYTSDGTMEWIRDFASSRGMSIAFDAGNNMYVVGSFSGSLNFGDTTLTSSSLSYFLAKFYPDHSLDWVQQSGVNGFGVADRLVAGVSWEGEACIASNFRGVMTIGGTQLNSIGSGWNMYVVKYHSDGTVAWTKQGAGGDSRGFGSVIDAQGNVYVTGFFTGSVDFGDTILTSSASPGYDAVLFKYDAAGTLQWVQTASHTNPTDRYANWPSDIAIDSFGNIYLTGTCDGDLKVGGILLKEETWGNDIYAAKFLANGSVAWAKRVGANHNDNGRGIAVDANGDVYITGYFEDTVLFEGNELQTALRNGNVLHQPEIFVWKLSSLPLQSDTSDAVFFIVMPQPLSHDIDMGNVLVGKMKDSVISTFVSNAGSYQFRVDSIAVIGSEFELVSGIPPFVVPANGAHQVEFRFQPTSPGPKSAQVMIITQADTLYQTITGNGIQPTILTIGTVIDFGAVETMTSKDTAITVAITNNGTVPVDFTGDAQLGPDKTQFVLLSGGGAFTLQPNESREVSIRFAPRFIGRTSGRIGFDYNGTGSPAILQLFGQGLGGLVRIADDSAYPGEKRNIPMELLGTPSASLQSLATGFRARVAYNSTVLAPFGGNVERGSGVDTVTVEGNLNTDNTLTNMPFLAALGNADVSSMDLVEFVWLDAQGQPANYDVETESGTFKLLGVCEEGGKRLFNPNGQVAITRISPNPASENMQVEIETIEAGRTLVKVMDVLGRVVGTLYDGEIATGSHKLMLNTSNIAAGSYYLSLETPTVKRFARVDVAR